MKRMIITLLDVQWNMMDTYIGTIISTMQQLLQAENITDRFAKVAILEISVCM